MWSTASWLCVVHDVCARCTTINSIGVSVDLWAPFVKKKVSNQ